MLQSFHLFLIFTILLLLSRVSGVYEYEQLQPVADTQGLHEVHKKSVNVIEESDVNNEAKLFENIQETGSTSTSKPIKVNAHKDESTKTLREIKGVLQKLLDKLNKMDNAYPEAPAGVKIYSSAYTVSTPDYEEIKPFLNLVGLKKRNENNLLRKPRWGQWTSWSACSVSCGRGREIRWRHCLEDCDIAETEMEEKACQLPACGPGKIFGIQL